MKPFTLRRALLFASAISLCWVLPASGGIAGFWGRYHNNTGVPADDFHMSGTLLTHGITPFQTAHIQPPGWAETGYTIGPGAVGGFGWWEWPVTVDWTGPAIPHCSTGLFGKEWEVGINAIWDLELTWTNGGLPIGNGKELSFRVDDVTRTLLLKNAGASLIDVSGYKIAMSGTQFSLADQAENVPAYAGLSWVALPNGNNGNFTLAAGQQTAIDISTILAPPGEAPRYLYTNFGVWDEGYASYLIHGEIHETPLPSAAQFVVGALGFTGLLSRRRRTKVTA